MSRSDEAAPTRRLRVGCVSFLNARPLIDGLDGLPELDVRYDVPSHLLDDLVRGDVDIALCPVVDFQTAPTPLTIVPVGGIGCDGATLTVRLFSRVPIERVECVHADPDSHTSVMLLEVILQGVYSIRPRMQALRPGIGGRDVESLLLIGDKVVRDAPNESQYPHQLDLGLAWKQWTGLPFVFAIWMCRQGRSLDQLPTILDAQRRANAERIDPIVAQYARSAGFDADVAKAYLGQLLKYDTGPEQLEAMQTFWRRAHELNLIAQLRPMNLYRSALSPMRI